MKPILFNTDMVRAILEGRKTVTRRVVKPQPPVTAHVSKSGRDYGWSFWEDNPEKHYMKPPYKSGDILWVRETFRVDYLSNIPGAGRVQYKDGTYMDIRFNAERYDMMRRTQKKPGWRPNENMFREAARIFLRVTGVRAERLQDMSVDDVFDEGVFVKNIFEHIWDRWRLTWDDTIKAKDRPTYGWEANPWVWVIEFEQCEKPDGWPG